MSDAGEHASEVASGRRFAFGRNWRRFAEHLDAGKIADAEQSVARTLAIPDLRGKRFLDIGCGSGLFSLAAARLGARVVSFDYDPDSVACTQRMKDRHYADDRDWTVERGSVLDRAYLESLGTFDIVYSWGVLHHTGEMWKAVENAADRVGQRGLLLIALYNDQGWRSYYWRFLKRLYNAHPVLRVASTIAHFPYPFAASLLVRLATGRLARAGGGEGRGMVYWYDYLDWLGGYPFEVAAPAEVTRFLQTRGFDLVRQTLTRRSGCNEFLFARYR